MSPAITVSCSAMSRRSSTLTGPEAALMWFKSYESGVMDDAYTVEQACKDYVQDRTEKGEECAHDADMRFKRTVYGTEFGKRPLAKLWMADVKNGDKASSCPDPPKTEL